MAFCILPCWTYFSAALRTFCLLNPKPNAIRLRTPAPGLNQKSVNQENANKKNMKLLGSAARSNCHVAKLLSESGRLHKGNCTAGRVESHGYQRLPKGSVRTGYLGNQG